MYKNLPCAEDFLILWIMQYFNFNGKIFEYAESVIGPENRGLRYGDGIFETLKIRNGKIILGDDHFARLWKGMQLLQFDFPKLFTPEKLEEEIYLLAKKNKLMQARVRLNIFRGNGGLYDVKNHFPQYIIEATSLSDSSGLWNNNGLQLCIYEQAKKSKDAFSNVKSNNFLPYIMGAVEAKKKQCNDALILNTDGNICDSTIANIFIFKDDVLYTPSLAEGCVAGILRKFFIDKCKELEMPVTETTISTTILLNADEVFLTNSIYNLRWVASVNNIPYTHLKTQQLFNQLCKDYPAVFC